MTEKIYFQWQNDVLRKAIYPVRDMKLRHFLLYYKEIDLWAEHKYKKIEDCPNEKKEYEEAQVKAITGAFNTEQLLRNYFLMGPVQPAMPNTDSAEAKDETERVVKLHAAFQMYFPKYENKEDVRGQDRKEKIFVAMRIAEWEQHRKEVKQKIAKKKSILNHSGSVNEEKKKELEVLEKTVLPKVERELEKLSALVAAQNKLEKRKEEFAKRQKENLKVEEEILNKLRPLQKKIESWEADKKRITDIIARLINLPNLDDILDYFSKADIYEKIRHRFTQGKVPAHDKVVDVIISTVRDTIGDTANSFHKDLIQFIQQWKDRGKKDPAGILQWIKGQFARLQDAQRKLDKVILALEDGAKSMQIGSPELVNRLAVINILSDAAMRAIIVDELDKFEDLQAAIEYDPSQKTKEVLDGMLLKEKSKLEQIQKDILENRMKAFEWEEALEPVESALQITRDKYLSTYVPDGSVRVKEDIVPFKAEQYNVWLETLDHDQLLYEVFQRFWNEPERFPLWLQYMMIHFSGMRYASAHGSWADPRELLLNLRTLDVQEELKNKKEDELQADCEGRVASYERSSRTRADTATYLPKFARAADKNSEEKIADYLTGLKSERSDKRRKSFLDLRIDEENYEINAMKAEEVLEELKAYKTEHNLPDWMWKEIVKLTDLRLTEVNKKREEKDKKQGGDWEMLTVDEQNKRMSNVDKQMVKYRDIMNKWKQTNLTGWRKEHDRANRLIVTRAVCNEVAEHIQHLRGHEGAAGLTQKPNWYMREEKKYYGPSNKRWTGPRAYFVKARDVDDFEMGASILWLRFVHEEPNEWRIAKPLETREGDGLIPNTYLGRNNDSGGWVYKPDPIMRTRTKTTTNGKKGSSKGSKENQWLRWMHEATVAAVEETAEGTVVLTFETALPYEDPSLSTIGLFKRYLSDLTREQVEDGYNAAFVGFVPEGKLPVSDLEELLDWNHILLKEVVSASELEEYRKKYIRYRKPPKITIRATNEQPTPVKAYLSICEFAEWTDSLAKANDNLYKVRIWGDPNLSELDVDTVNTTNFQAFGLYNEVTGRGAVTNFITIERDDIDNLMAMQVEDEYVHKHPDWLKQKMNWLCKRKGTIYFTAEGRQGWQTAPSIRWGTLALGGNLVQVKRFVDMKIKVGGKKKDVKMAELVGFSKSDWSTPLDDLLANGLVHRCFCAYKGNKPGDTPKGIVYSPFFGLQNWKFGEKGQKKPEALYIPVDQLVKPGSKDEDGKEYEGIPERLKCGQ